jgi:hypothetical protein
VDSRVADGGDLIRWTLFKVPFCLRWALSKYVFARSSSPAAIALEANVLSKAAGGGDPRANGFSGGVMFLHQNACKPLKPGTISNYSTNSVGSGLEWIEYSPSQSRNRISPNPSGAGTRTA